jgi:hypothetical protein
MPKSKVIVWLLLVAALAAPAVAVASGDGVIKGFVKDGDGLPLPGVMVSASSPALADGPRQTWADADGSFFIDGLPQGAYAVEAVLDGFQPSKTELTLVQGQTVTFEFKLAFAVLEETIEVRAEVIASSEVTLLDQRRQSSVVSDSISAQEISRTPDADAAGVVDRLTGVSLVDDKYVYVRGLGERYSSTTLNGASIASTETDRKVVPLDLFPAKLLETIDVVKTYTPDMPAAFGSGVVQLNTLAFPTSRLFRVQLGAGYNSNATGAAHQTYAGGVSMLGEGGQPLPSSIPDKPLEAKDRFNPDGYTHEEMQQFGLAFGPKWTGDSPESAPYNGNFNVTYGDTLGHVGVLVSAVGSHGYETRDEVSRYYKIDAGDTLVVGNDYDLVTDSESVRNGLLGAFSVQVAEGQTIKISSMFTRDARGESRTQEGFNASGSYDIRDYRTRYEKEELLNTRLVGEHVISGIGQSSFLEWSVAQSDGTREQDLRENLYTLQSDGTYYLATGYPEVGKMEYFDLEDSITDAGASWATYFDLGSSRYGSVKGGLAYTDRSREFSARRFRYITQNPNQFDLTLTPEELFTPENIRPDGWEVLETTGVNDAYTGDHEIKAGYAMADLTLGKLRLIGGVRYEDSVQTVLTFDPFDASTPEQAINDNQDVLPALNAVYQLSGRTNLRFAASRTLNRPEFRELSPFAFVEVTGGRSIAGNPDLEQATIDGIDFRWETFPEAGEVLAVSVFYKKIDQPIERYVQATSELRTSWLNAESADLQGIELELRRSLAIIAPALKNWSTNLNYSYVDSSVTIPPADLSVLTTNNRALQGQAKHVGNFAIQYFHPAAGTLVRVLYGYTGERLSDVGVYGLPDIIESSTGSLDLVVSQSLSRLVPGLDVKVTASNLLDSESTYTQGGELQRQYSTGTAFGLSFGYTY